MGNAVQREQQKSNHTPCILEMQFSGLPKMYFPASAEKVLSELFKTPSVIIPSPKPHWAKSQLIETSLVEKPVTRLELAQRIYRKANDLCRNCTKVKGWYTRKSKSRNGRKLSECLDPNHSAKSLFTDLDFLCSSPKFGQFEDDEVEAALKAFSEIKNLLTVLKSLQVPEALYSLNDAFTELKNIILTLRNVWKASPLFTAAIMEYLTPFHKFKDVFSRLALNYELEEINLLQAQPMDAKTSRRKPHDTRTYLQLFKLYKGVIITTQSKTKYGEPELDNNNKPKTFTGVVTDKHLTNCCFKQKAITTFKKYITLKYAPHIPRKRKRHDDVFEMMDTILRGKFSPIVKGSLLEDLGTAIFKELCNGEGSLSQRRKNGFRKFRDKHISVFDS